MFMVSDWLVFGVINLTFNFLYCFYGEGDKYASLLPNTIIIGVLTFVFSLNEKVRKEAFIINMTNSKTKKQLMKIFN